MKYFWITFLMMLSLSSCVSVSKSPFACSAVVKGEPIVDGRIGRLIGGNVLQIGDCAISERLRVETGTYLKNRQSVITKQITNEKAEYRDDMLALYELFGCGPENERELLRFSRANYSSLFENVEKASGRETMLSIRKKLKDDSVLKELCFN